MRLLDRLLGRADAARPLASGTRARGRSDGLGGRWSNALSGQGTALDRHAHTEFIRPRELDQVTVDSLLEFQAMARRIVHREPEDATREGYTITGIPDEINDMVIASAEGSATVEGLGVSRTMSEARAWSRAFGGGAVVIMADDGMPAAEPINTATLRAIRGLTSVDRHELRVHQYGLDPSDPNTFGKPIMFSLSQQLGTHELIHADRVATFQGIELPMRAMIRKNGWGGSVLDLAWAEIRNYATTNDYITEAVTLLTQGVLETDWLGDAIDSGDQQKVIDRMEAMRISMGMLGDLAIDKEHEAYTVHTRTMSGLKDAVDAVTNALVAASDMPRSILLGETPGGLNAGGNEGEIRSWYDHVAALQDKLYTPVLRKVLLILMASAEGPTRGIVPEGWGIEWNPLWQLSEAEQETTNLTRAQRRSMDLQSQVITADEARREGSLVDIYGHDPNAPAAVVEPPEAVDPDAPLDDEAELAPVVAANPNAIPKGEVLIGGREAASRLGVSAGTIHKMASRGQFPAWRVGSRWRYAWSLVEAATSNNVRSLAP